MRKTVFNFLLLGTVISCQEKIHNSENKENQYINEAQAARNDSVNAQFSFMNVPMEELPVSETNRFETFDEAYRKKHPSERVYAKLSNEQVEKLGLQKWLKSGKNVTVNYQLSFPGNFKTFVLTYLDRDSELKTLMVTFDRNYKKIDELLVAYDGSPRFSNSTTSSISSSNISVHNVYRASRRSETINSSYLIRETGKFEKRKK
ncbi:hypothetical protein [Chryseobacterium sp. JM1]|uniref:hypothetical protein n=1 Tax=Chryseobacterium sp. JM1 TaxID=1233950 RepID=UPI000A492462|nr:hypothetical protein [Chryseobacterium sp. JM1]